LELIFDEYCIAFTSVINSARLDVQLIPEKIMLNLWNTGNLVFSLLSTLEQLFCMRGILDELIGFNGLLLFSYLGLLPTFDIQKTLLFILVVSMYLANSVSPEDTSRFSSVHEQSCMDSAHHSMAGC